MRKASIKGFSIVFLFICFVPMACDKLSAGNDGKLDRATAERLIRESPSALKSVGNLQSDSELSSSTLVSAYGEQSAYLGNSQTEFLQSLGL